MSLFTNSPQRNSTHEEGIIVENAFSHLPPQQRLPTEMILHIFSFLLPEDLARPSGVCRQWYDLANDYVLWKRFDPKKLFPSLQIIDRTVWKRCVDLEAFGLSFEDIEPFDNRELIPALKTHFHHVDQAKLKVENNAGWTVVEQPKGLDFNRLVKLAASPKQGNITLFRYIDPDVSDEFGECTVNKTYRFIMTNNVLERSRGLTFDAQRELAEKAGCEMPGFLEAASLVVLTHMDSSVESPIRLYSDEPLTYTRCHQRVHDLYPLAVGGFAPAGVSVGRSFFGRDVLIGVAALRKF